MLATDVKPSEPLSTALPAVQQLDLARQIHKLKLMTFSDSLSALVFKDSFPREDSCGNAFSGRQGIASYFGQQRPSHLRFRSSCSLIRMILSFVEIRG